MAPGRQYSLRQPWAAIPALVLALSACAGGPNTTGDPTQGGLIGWSPEKARQRQLELEANAASAKAEAKAERQRTTALLAAERDASETVNRLNQQLISLESENDRLETELSALIESRKLRGSEAERLNSVLRKSRDMRKDLARQAAQRPATVPPTESQLSAIDAQNRLLHQEVMLLLER